MDFISKFDQQVKEHGLSHVLFVHQVAWMATLGISKKGFFIRSFIIILMSPIFLLLGYGEFAEALKIAGTATYEHPLANLFAAMFLFLHYGGIIFPYLLVLNIIVFFSTRMWTKEFWKKVEEIK